PSLERDRGAAETGDGPDLRQGVCDREVLDRVDAGKAADFRVRLRRDGETRPQALVGVWRARPREPEHVVPERDLVDPPGPREVLVLGKPVLERVDRDGRRSRIEFAELTEEVVRQPDVRIGDVDPRRRDLLRMVQARDQVATDLSREADPLARRKVVARLRAIEEENLPARVREKARFRRLREA